MNANYITIITLILFLVLTIRGYRKGFLRMMVYFVGMILIVISIRYCSPYVNEYLINNTSVYSQIKENVAESLREKNSVLDNTIEENQELTIESYDMPSTIKKCLLRNNTLEVYKKLLVDVFEEYVSSFLAMIAIKAITYIGLLIFFWIIFRLVLWACKIIAKIPIIRGINKLAGAAVGFSEALIIASIFFTDVLK